VSIPPNELYDTHKPPKKPGALTTVRFDDVPSTHKHTKKPGSHRINVPSRRTVAEFRLSQTTTRFIYWSGSSLRNPASNEHHARAYCSLACIQQAGEEYKWWLACKSFHFIPHTREGLPCGKTVWNQSQLDVSKSLFGATVHRLAS